MTSTLQTRRSARRLATSTPTYREPVCRRGAAAVDTRPVIIFIYTRISNDPLGKEAGVARQLADMTEWAERAHPGATVVSDYCDNDKSASTRTKTIRPRYDQLLMDARAAAKSGLWSQVIIAAYTSGRLTRRPREHEGQLELAEDFGVQYHFDKSPSFDLNTAAGRRVARILAANDAGEAEDTQERIVRAKKQTAVDGEYGGGALSFGYDVVYEYNARGLPITPGTLVLKEKEAEAIRWAVDRLLAGGALREITRRWNADGLTTTYGNPWTPTQVRNVLSRGRIAGLAEYKGEYVGVGKWPAIIDEEELRAVHVLLSDPKRKSHNGAYTRKWLVAGIGRCGKPDCTSDIRSAGGHKGSPTKYECREHGHCVIDAEAVDAYVRTVVAGYIDTHKPTERVVDMSDEAERLERERNMVAALIEALDEEFDGGMGEMSQRAYAVQSRKLETRWAEIDAAQAELIVPERVVLGVERGADFLNADLAQQRTVVQHLVTVTILPGKRGGSGKRLISDRVRVELAEQYRTAA